MKEHYIDSRFSEELEGLEANPPVEAWLAVMDALDHKRKNHRKLLFSRAAAAAAIFLVASFSLWLTIMNENTPGMELQLSQAIPGTLQSSGINHVGSIEAPVPAINKKDIDHPQTLLPSSSDQQFSAWAESGSQLASLPAAEIQQLEINRPKTPATAPASEIITKTRFKNNQTRLIASVTPQKNRKTSISLGAHMAPQYNYRYHANASSNEYLDIPFQSLESEIFSYSAGLSAYIRFSQAWALQTGINFNNTGQFVDGIESYHHPENTNLHNDYQYVITSLGGVRIHDTYHHFEDIMSYRVLSTRQTKDFGDVKNLHKVGEGLTQTFSYIEIPLLIRYNVYRRNIGVEFKGGVSGNYLLRKDVYLGSDIFHNPIGETFGAKQFNFSVIGGFALNLPITGNITLHLEPTAQLFLQPVVLEGFRINYALPYNFSLQTGFSYRF